jgi:predicted phosphohydrolase
VGEVDYDKIINREVGRLRLSLEAAKAIQKQETETTGQEREIIPFLHFPPVFGDFRCREIMDVLAGYGVRRCYYGHIHSDLPVGAPSEVDGIHYILCAADHLRFTPMPVFPTERFHFS